MGHLKRESDYFNITEKKKTNISCKNHFLKVIQNGKLSVSGRKKSFPKFNVKSIQAITISFIFVSGFGTKKRFSQ